MLVAKMRARGLLRQLAQQARNQALPYDAAPVIKSFEPGEDWAFCYVDELMFEPAPRPLSV